MPKATSAQTNFTKGELSPKLFGRFDITGFVNGAKKLLNFLILNAGGGTRRPGAKFVGHVKDSSLATRLIEFVFSTTQTYIIEMGNLYMRFYSNNGRVVEDDIVITGATKAKPVVISTDGAHGYSNGDWVILSEVVGMTELNGKTFIVADKNANDFELTDVDGDDVDGTGFTTYVSDGVSNKVLQVTTPYTTAQLFDVSFAQTADLMYLAHSSHAPRTLSRTAANAFTLAVVTFVGGPFKDDNITAITITPSGDTGAGITLTASSAIFDTTNHLGAFWKVKDGYVKINGFSSTSVADDCDVQLKQDGSAGDLNTGPAATLDWAEGAWSIDEGYPGVVSFHEQRIVYARSTNQLQTFWASFIRVFTDFFQGTNASDAYTYEIASDQVNSIRWLSSSAKALHIGTFGGTFSASSGTTNVPITPSSIVVQLDTTYGSSSIKPKRIGSFVYYIMNNLTVLRELGFNFDIDSQEALDMNILSDHILGTEGDTTGVKDMAYQQSPNSRLWIVRKDGEVATLTRQIPQEVIGWSRQVFGGTFQAGIARAESVAVIPGLTGDDQVWLIIKRTINGTTRRYVEFIMPETFVDQDDAFFVDSGLSLDNPKTITAATKAKPVVVTSTAHGFSNGDQIKIVDVLGMTELNNLFYKVKNVAANTFELTDTDDDNIDGTGFTTYVSGGEAREMVLTISGLEHLEGETVQILADGAVLPDEDVSSGSITLETRVAKAHIGRHKNADIQGLPLGDGSPLGTGQTKDRRIYIGTFRFYKTVGGTFGREGVLNEIFSRSPSDVLNRPPPLVTDDVRLKFPAGWDRRGEFFIRQAQPLPMTVLAVILSSQVEDK